MRFSPSGLSFVAPSSIHRAVTAAIVLPATLVAASAFAQVPPPDVTIDMPVEAPATSAITAVAATPHAPAPPVHVGTHKAPTTAKNFPNSEDYYPAASKRLNEEGAPTVHVCVGANSKLTAAPTIAQSSGSARLDDGALNLAKAGRYVPGSDDGKPIDGCFDFRIKFQMTK